MPKIKSYIDFFTLHNVSSSGSNRRQSLLSNQRWSPPQAGVVLINVDAVIFAHFGQAGFGVTVRDQFGTVQAVSQAAIDHVLSRKWPKPLLCGRLSSLPRFQVFRVFLVSFDCLSLINKVQSSEFDRSSNGTIVQDIKTRASMFLACNFVHVKRCSNVAAHVLAKSAERYFGSYWYNEHLKLPGP